MKVFRRWPWRVAAAAMTAIVVACALLARPVVAATTDGSSGVANTADIILGHVLVKLGSQATSQSGQVAFETQYHLRQIVDNPDTGWALYTYDDATAPQAKVDELKASGDVEDASVDLRVHSDAFPQTPPNDPYYTDPYGGYAFPEIKALQAWQHSAGTTKYVAIVDTGISYDNYPELGSFVTQDYCDSTGSVVDNYGHGTWVAGVAAAATNNGVGIAGISYASPIMVVKFYDGRPGYTCPYGEGEHYAGLGITWAVDHGAAVINASWDFYGTDDQLPDLKAAVDYAWAHNVPVVAATGNFSMSNFNEIAPAEWYHAIAVGASDSGHHRWSGSDYGMPGVDIAAPGVDIITTDLGGRYTWATGTSLAVPFVTGTIGLMLRRYPNLSSLAVKQRLWNSAQKLGGYDYSWSSFCGGQSAELGCGILNAYAAIL